MVEVPSTVRFDAVEAILSEIGEQELPLLAGLRLLGEPEIGRRLATGAKRDDPLGFGLGEVVTLMTPVVWVAVQEAAKQVAGEAVGDTTKGLFERLRAKLRRRRPQTLPHALTPDQLTAVHAKVLAVAENAGLDSEHATLFADGVVGRLAMDGRSDGATGEE